MYDERWGGGDRLTRPLRLESTEKKHSHLPKANTNSYRSEWEHSSSILGVVTVNENNQKIFETLRNGLRYELLARRFAVHTEYCRNNTLPPEGTLLRGSLYKNRSNPKEVKVDYINELLNENALTPEERMLVSRRMIKRKKLLVPTVTPGGLVCVNRAGELKKPEELTNG